MDAQKSDFFISYAEADLAQASRIKRLLEGAGFSTIFQAADSHPGEDFVIWIERAIRESCHTLAVVSDTYLKSDWCTRERTATQTTKGRKLFVVRIEDIDVTPLMRSTTRIDLFDASSEEEWARRLTLIRLTPIRPSPRRPVLPTTDYSNLSFLKPPLKGKDELFAVAFSPDGRWVAAGSQGRVLLWDRRQLNAKAIALEGPKSYVYAVAFSSDSRYVACGSEDRGVRVWDLTTRTLLWGPSARGNDHRHDDAVYSVAFSPNGRELVSGGYDKKVKRWSIPGGQHLGDQHVAMQGIGRVSSAAFSPDGKIIAVGSHDNSLWLWPVGSDGGEEPQELIGHVGPGSLAADGAGARLLEAAHASSVEGVAFSPDGKLLASCGLDKVVRIWDLASCRQIRRCIGHDYLVRSVAFSPDSSTLASASWDKTLRLWDVRSGRELRTMKSESLVPWHTDWIWSVAFSPDGRVLASAGSDASLLLWEIGMSAQPTAPLDSVARR